MGRTEPVSTPAMNCLDVTLLTGRVTSGGHSRFRQTTAMESPDSRAGFESRSRRKRRAGWLAALWVAIALALAASSTALADFAPSEYRVNRVCGRPQPRMAACAALTLRPVSLTQVELEGDAAREAGEVARGVTPAVLFKDPHPGALSPEELHAAYSLPAETASSYLQTIAVIDAYNDPSAESDLRVYDQQFGLPACTMANGCFRKVNQEGRSAPLPPTEGAWAAEISLDVQIAHATCQNCRILLVEANSAELTDLGAAVNAAVDIGATEISNSIESLGGEAASVATLNAHYYDHAGVVITASAGDCGYLGSNPEGLEVCDERPAGVSFPASSPDVVAVGGTSLIERSGIWHSTVWSNSGGGCDSIFAGPLWQVDVVNWPATSCGAARLVADVAAVADPRTGVDVYDSTPYARGYPRLGWEIDGGTSVASPLVAGEFALAGGAHGVAYPAATLYQHIGDGGALYDVVSGSNGSCAGGTACEAAVGYDGPSGVGSPLGLAAFFTPGAPTPVSPPRLLGGYQQGEMLIEVHGEWDNDPIGYAYQWARCAGTGEDCEAIAGATGQTYTPTAADVGSTIRVQETARNAVGVGPPAVSAPTAAIVSGVPTISSFSPSSGVTGSGVTIDGAALGDATEVRFGRSPASYTIVSPTRIVATVPNGARAGKISVITPIGTARSLSEFSPTFSVTAFHPKGGPPEKVVAVDGIGFNGGTTVSFGGVAAASVTYVSATEVKATVPRGASTGPISVTNGGIPPSGTVTSASSYTVE